MQHVESNECRRRLDRLVSRCRANLRTNKPPTFGLKPDEVVALAERYSTFQDSRKDGFVVGGEHVIHKLVTPRPFLHLMASIHPRNKGMFASFWDQYGGGFCSLDSVLAGTITSHGDPNYVPTAPRPDDFRGLVLREQSQDGNYRAADGQRFFCWNAIPQCDPHDRRYSQYECRQGIGYSLTSAIRNDIMSRILAFVPVDDTLEVWEISLGNMSGRKRRLSLFTWVKWGINSYPGYYFDPRVVCAGEVHREWNALCAVNNDQNNKAPRSGFMMAGRRFKSFDLSAEVFTGGAARYVLPYAAMQGYCSNSVGVQPYMGLVGAMHFDLELAPRGTTTLTILVGATEPDNKRRRSDLARIHNKYFAKRGSARRELSRLRDCWHERISLELCSTGDDELDRFFNIWSKYQANSTARFTRALDKVGYRDVLQDLMSITPFDPEFARTEFLTALRYQFDDGRAVRQYERFSGGGHDERMYMDSPLWMVDTLMRYVCDTGDFAILREKIPFLRSRKTGSVYEHAKLGLESCYSHRGQKGLCLTGHGDWNDALDGIGRGGRGVSVWLSMALVFFSRELLHLAEHIGDKAGSARLQNIINTMTRNINRHAWDGRYYVYGFDDKGRPIGSRRNREGRIHLNVNTWALLSGVAEAGGHVEDVIQSIEALNTPIGHLLLDPPYTAQSRHVGRIADMQPGMFENGAVYTHGQSFFIAAMIKMGRGTDAYRALKATMPGATIPDISTAPLHQQTNFAVGKAHPNFGQHLYTNFTGSLAWYRRAIEWMLGVVPDLDALVISPCIPATWRQYRVVRHWRGGEYHVTVCNPDGVERGVREVRVDGEPIGGTRIPPMAGRHEVDVLMGV